MKKLFLVMAIATLVTAGVCAQDAQNWISGEASIFGVGARYERMLNDKMSVGANVYWNTLIFWNEVELGGSFRYYLFPTFFVGGGLGFHVHTGVYDYEYTHNGRKYADTWWGAVSGVAISPEVGWKIDVGSKSGFFIQPGVKMPITFGKLEAYNRYTDSEFKVGLGIVPYFGLGGAF